ncbi:MAG TPA: GAF domain-containing protein, partial [Terriglobales bacterium]|nr:GAF domain-containing protein [Terriglobales bacterium]
MQSVGTSPDEIGRKTCDRRRSARHKVQIPAYVSLTGMPSTRAPAWMKIVDISESGMAIQPSFPLEPGQRRTSLLNLPESKALIRIETEVVRTDASWRAGIQFHAMTEESLCALKHWLSANRTPRSGEQIPQETIAPSVAEDRGQVDRVVTTHPDSTALLAAVEAMQPEVEALGSDRDAAVRLIVRRAQAFTHAAGAALALAEGEEMICRASTGDAPHEGARFHIGSGFSGECVRSGSLLRCDDSETDPRVDRTNCRTLGIRAMLAVPISSQSAIIGLLEVFSRQAHAFGSDDEFVLLRLARMAAGASERAGSAADLPVPSPAAEDAADARVDRHTPQRASARNGILIAVLIPIVFVIVWVIGTWQGDGWRRSRTTAAPVATGSRAPLAPAQPRRLPNALSELRGLAEQGDAAAQFAMGVRYETGEGVDQNDLEAVRWFNKAAEQDDPGAQAMLGAYYWAGRGVPADPVQAYFWSILAEAGGD